MKTSKSGQLIIVCNRLRKKLPQGISPEKQTFDFVGHPDAKGASTAHPAISIAAEHASGANGFVQLMIGVVATQEAVFDQCSDPFAVRTRSEFEPRVQIVKFLVGRQDTRIHD